LRPNYEFDADPVTNSYRVGRLFGPRRTEENFAMIALKPIVPTLPKCGLFLVLLSAAAGSGAASAQTLNTLVSFSGADGANPYAGLIADSNGNLFGTTQAGGTYQDGTVFEMAKTSSGYASTPSTLVSFSGADGANPLAALIADANGNLFGTTYFGGTYQDGTVFEIAKTSSGYGSTPTTLVSFNQTDGATPVAGLIADSNGNLFGTTSYGGAPGYGTAFEITNSGFVPAKKFAGTPGTANCIGESVSTMAQTYGGLAHAASSLGYNSMSALLSAVSSYCIQ
jgi:hypothetical protein